MGDVEILPGGVANAGAVVRVGDHVLRPSNPSSELIQRFLRHVRASGFDGVPEPLGFTADGRERLVYVDGDVAIPPFAAWSLTDGALASTAALLRRLHTASVGFEIPADLAFNTELADPGAGGAGTDELVVCHNDVCPENVVFVQGAARVLLDFDLAAPGRPLYDLAQMAKMWVPLDTPEDAAVMRYGRLDPFHRLRVLADAYGLPPGREAFVEVLGQAIERGGAFVRRHVEWGEAGFVAMWEATGGQARYDRRQEWFDHHRPRFLEALG